MINLSFNSKPMLSAKHKPAKYSTSTSRRWGWMFYSKQWLKKSIEQHYLHIHHEYSLQGSLYNNFVCLFVSFFFVLVEFNLLSSVQLMRFHHWPWNIGSNKLNIKFDICITIQIKKIRTKKQQPRLRSSLGWRVFQAFLATN